MTEDEIPKYEFKEQLPKQAAAEVTKDFQLSQLQIYRELIEVGVSAPKHHVPRDFLYDQMTASIKLHDSFKREIGKFDENFEESAIKSRVDVQNGIQFATSFNGSLMVVDSHCNTRFNRWVLAERVVKTHTNQGLRGFGRDLVYLNDTLYYISPDSGLMHLKLSTAALNSLEFKLRCKVSDRHPQLLQDPSGIVVWVERFFKPTRVLNVRCSSCIPSGLNKYLLYATEAGELGRYIPPSTRHSKTSLLVPPVFSEQISLLAEGFDILVAAATNNDHSRVQLAVLDSKHLALCTQRKVGFSGTGPLVTVSIFMHRGLRMICLVTADHVFSFYGFYRRSISALKTVSASLERLIERLPRKPSQDVPENPPQQGPHEELNDQNFLGNNGRRAARLILGLRLLQMPNLQPANHPRLPGDMAMRQQAEERRQVPEEPILQEGVLNNQFGPMEPHQPMPPNPQ